MLPDAVRRSWHPALRSLLKAHGALVRRVVGRVRRYHAAYAREIWLDEVRGLASLDETEAVVTSGKDEGITLEERAEAYDFTLKVRTYIDRRDDGRDPLRGVDLEGWLATFLDGQPEQVWRQGEWGELLGETWVMLGLDGHAVPPGLDLSRLPRLAEGVEERRFVVAQRCDRLSVGVEGGDVAQRGSPLVTVAANARWITIGGRHHALDEVRVLDLPLPPGDELELSTDRVERVRLRLETKPGWARELVRDRTGLHVMPLRWAAAHGEDEFGLWATFRVGEVEQRMRWIASRQSVMGSPPTEQGRDDDEGPQHEVVLTEGYWLADTPCTQALWTAVMGSNPSAYQSSRHPVEQVSWDEVQEFCVALNERVQGLEAGLPTEAQWEHACRAGTTAATYAGDLDILGENNAPGLDEIAWYGGNSGVGYELEKGGGPRVGRTSSTHTRRREPGRWPASDPTRGGCTICWATCGNGAQTCVGTTDLLESSTPSDPLARGVSSVGAAGAATPASSVLRSGSGSSPATAATTLASGSLKVRDCASQTSQTSQQLAMSKSGKQGRGPTGARPAVVAGRRSLVRVRTFAIPARGGEDERLLADLSRRFKDRGVLAPCRRIVEAHHTAAGRGCPSGPSRRSTSPTSTSAASIGIPCGGRRGGPRCAR